MRLQVVIALLLVFAATPRLLHAEDPLLSSDEIKKLVDAGQYKDALKSLYRILALQGPAAAPYDRFDMLMLRAECQLQIKDSQGALASLELAKKEAFAQKKFENAAQPAALTLLIQKSSAYAYKPRATHDTISILDRTLRPAAYAALFADEYPAAKKAVESLNNAKTLAPVFDAAKTVGPVRAVEIIANPSTSPAKLQTSQLATQITTNADRLLVTAVDDYNKQMTTIASVANQVVNDTVYLYDERSKKAYSQPRTRRRGLTNKDEQTLNAIIAGCDKVHSTCADLAFQLASNIDVYQAIVTRADAAKTKASDLLNDDYLQPAHQ